VSGASVSISRGPNCQTVPATSSGLALSSQTAHFAKIACGGRIVGLLDFPDPRKWGRSRIFPSGLRRVLSKVEHLICGWRPRLKDGPLGLARVRPDRAGRKGRKIGTFEAASAPRGARPHDILPLT
jgi:hypothetical protein